MSNRPYGAAISFMASVIVAYGSIISDANAQNETPKTTTVYVWRAQSEIWPDHYSFMTDQLTNQGYSRPVIYERGTGTPCNGHFCQFQDALTQGVNLWIDSHGGNVIESYDKEAERNNRVTQLKTAHGDWWDAGYLFFSTTGDGSAGNPKRYVICVSQAGAAKWCKDNKQIIYLGGCSTAGWFASYKGGLMLGYWGSWNGSEDEPNATLLFQRMSGAKANGTMRCSKLALTGVTINNGTNGPGANTPSAGGFTPNFRAWGSIVNSMVLSPAVRGTNVRP